MDPLETRLWRWIFGLALAPPALVLLPLLGRTAETGVLMWAAAFAITYLASLFATAVAVIVGALCFSAAGDFIKELSCPGG